MSSLCLRATSWNKADGHMPDAYMMHPFVLGHNRGDLPAPFSILVDGVQYSNDDSCIGVWLINEIDSHRCLLAALRKKIHLCMRVPALVYLPHCIPRR